MSKQVVYITGTSSGFGRDLVHQLADRGHKVIATARSLSKIEDLAKLENVKTQQLDVTDTVDNLKKKVDEAITFFGKIDILVNNAGHGLIGCFEESSELEIKQQFDTNFFGTVNLTQIFLKYFRSTKTQSIISTVTSMGGSVAFPTLGAYVSTKFALEGFYEALDQEVKVSQLPIKVLILAPGAFKTNIVANNKKAERVIDDYQPIKDKMEQFFKSVESDGGSSAIGAKLMADAMLGEGFAKGKEVPLRLPIASDAVNITLDKFKKETEVYEAWRPFASESDAK
ncbi:hypothetical protein E3P99_04136 [Wallemia hederae]|uniref:NAD(P)-binding domain-containing protein n=1 Tax=Wallemia hederae TaxID=1540922 RepID=A0A4T0F9R9_9BASI|nr:hypothetical protein E3P99_04136 [Wallemia hederae]